MITVFGATGTTGAPLVEAILAKGAKVRAVTSAPARKGLRGDRGRFR